MVGALDLGGASTQITFLPGTTIDDSSTRVVLRLYGTNYSIYTHSYLCYGQNQALKMLMASLYQVTTSSLAVLHSPSLTELGRQHPLGVTAAGLGANSSEYGGYTRATMAGAIPWVSQQQRAGLSREGDKYPKAGHLTTGVAGMVGAWDPCAKAILPIRSPSLS